MRFRVENVKAVIEIHARMRITQSVWLGLGARESSIESGRYGLETANEWLDTLW